MIIELGIIVCIGFLLRLVPLAVPMKGFLSDRMGSLYQTRRQSQSKWININPIASIQKGLLMNSPFVMWLISRFSKRYWMLLGGMLSICSDLLIAVCVYFLCHLYFSHGMEPVAGLSLEGWASLLYVTTPGHFILSNSRLRGGVRARAFGGVITFSYFVSLFLYSMSGNLLWAGFAVLLVPVAVISSVFATQVIIFLTAFYALVSFDYIPLLISVSGVALAVLPTPLYSHHVLRWKYIHLKYYFEIVKKGRLREVNNLGLFFQRLQISTSAPFEVLRFVLADFSPIAAVLSVPIVCLLVFFSVEDLSNLTPLAKFSLLLFSSGYLVALATSFRRLMFLGEGYRYMEYVAPFLVITYVGLVGQSGIHNGLLLLGLALNAIILLLHAAYFFRKNLVANLSTSLDLFPSGAIERLNSLEGNALTLPVKMSRGLGAVVENNKLMFYQRLVFKNLKDCKHYAFELDPRDPENPTLKNLENIRSRYPIHYIVSAKSLQKPEDTETYLSGLKVDYEDDVLKIYRT